MNKFNQVFKSSLINTIGYDPIEVERLPLLQKYYIRLYYKLFNSSPSERIRTFVEFECSDAYKAQLLTLESINLPEEYSCSYYKISLYDLFFSDTQTSYLLFLELATTDVIFDKVFQERFHWIFDKAYIKFLVESNQTIVILNDKIFDEQILTNFELSKLYVNHIKFEDHTSEFLHERLTKLFDPVKNLAFIKYYLLTECEECINDLTEWIIKSIEYDYEDKSKYKYRKDFFNDLFKVICIDAFSGKFIHKIYKIQNLISLENREAYVRLVEEHVKTFGSSRYSILLLFPSSLTSTEIVQKALNDLSNRLTDNTSKSENVYNCIDSVYRIFTSYDFNNTRIRDEIKSSPYFDSLKLYTIFAIYVKHHNFNFLMHIPRNCMTHNILMRFAKDYPFYLGQYMKDCPDLFED
ncbi:gp197 [Sphingomonas phage PAU]|uniref:gp197 n=1 Tax=Sphingomonas phage PAU TaxID=1150991 RepID=UPI0002573363|nr:gp197 [Sphingomonas phage PAU]AFF28195.1 gp197 [Sphingomonas phage PAU]